MVFHQRSWAVPLHHGAVRCEDDRSAVRLNVRVEHDLILAQDRELSAVVDPDDELGSQSRG